MTLSPSELARYSRHLSLREIGASGQEKLKAAKVLVIGAGGLGSPAILYLASAGVGTIGVVDCDSVDVSNLQRQILFDTADVGTPKTQAARERLQTLNPELNIVTHQVELRAQNVREIIQEYDLVLDGTDRFATRYLINDACVMLDKPLISAAIHRFEGQVFTYVPHRGPCYRCLFPNSPSDGLIPNCADAGVLGVLPGVLGTIQATEAIKLIVGIGELLLGRLLTYDALAMRFSEFKFERREECAVCGKNPTIAESLDAVDLCSVETLAGIRRLSARQLHALVGDPSLVLVDVREPREYRAGSLPAAINIPVAELANRLHELSISRTPVFICRSGARSLVACGIASRAGIKSLAHLEGGLLAWTEIEPSLFIAPVG